MTFREIEVVPEVATTVSVYEPGTGPDEGVTGLFAIVPMPPHADVTSHAESARNIARCAKRSRPRLNFVNNSLRHTKTIAGRSSANAADWKSSGT